MSPTPGARRPGPPPARSRPDLGQQPPGPGTLTCRGAADLQGGAEEGGEPAGGGGAAERLGDWGGGAGTARAREPQRGGGGGLEWLTSAHVGQDNVITVADRRVDLSGEGASLYSQCRRWVQNAPEEAVEPPVANPAGAEPAEAGRGPEREGPPPETVGPEVVEPPDWSQLLDPERQPTVEELKKHHLVHWVKVRKSRLKHRQNKLERFNRKLARLLASDTAPPLGASESEKPGG